MNAPHPSSTLLCCTLAIILTANACAQIIVNGDFESPLAPTGQADYAPANPNWVWTGNSGIISPPGYYPPAQASFLAPAAPSGAQIAFVQNANSSMSQTFNLTAAGTYTLSYSDAGRPLWLPGVGGNTTYQVFVDTNVIATVATTTGQPFSTKAFLFTAPAGAHELKFQIAATNVYDNTAFFDNIQISLEHLQPVLAVKLFAGIEIKATIGTTNRIEYTEDVAGSNWMTLTNLVQTAATNLFIDLESTTSPRRFYRAMELP